MPYDFREVFALSARQATPLALAKGLDMSFDCEARRFEAPGNEDKMRGAAMRLFHASTEMLVSGDLHLNAETLASGPSAVELVMMYGGVGQGVSSESVAATLDWLQLSIEDRSKLNRSALSASGHCPVTGASVQFKALEGFGFSIRSALRCECDGTALDTPFPSAGGASAWVIASSSLRCATWKRRLSRLGWRVTSFFSYGEAIRALQFVASPPPKLVIGRGAEDEDEVDMATLYAIVGQRARLVHVVDAGACALRGRWRVPGYEVAVFPLGPSHLEALTIESGCTDPVEKPHPRAKRALVVADELDALITRVYLEAMDFHVLVAANGADAIEACRGYVPDIAVMSLGMPLRDGPSFARQLRGLQIEGVLPYFPLIGAAAAWTPQLRSEALTAGMNECIATPIDIKTFQEEINRFSKL